MKKTSKKFSDKELRALLASMKEEVAAPPEFRARLLARLVPQANQPRKAAPTWTQNLVGYFSRPLWTGAAASIALFGFALWFVAGPQQQAAAPSNSSAAAALAGPAIVGQPSRVVSRPKPAHVSASSSMAAAPSQRGASDVAPAAELASGSTALGAGAAADVQSSSSGEISGASSAPPGPGIPQFSAVGSAAAAAPGAGKSMGSSEIIVIKPSPTPMVNPLLGNSQVRRNKFRASLGEYAAILYKTKGQEKVRIEIFDRLGHSVALLQDGEQGVGNYEIHWFGHDGNGDLSPSGIYLIHISTEHYNERHKVVFIR